MRIGFTLATGIICFSGGALAQAVDGTAAKQDQDRVICKRDRENALGSHLRAPKTCMKASEWAELKRQTDRMTQKLKETPGTVVVPKPSSMGAGN